MKHTAFIALASLSAAAALPAAALSQDQLPPVNTQGSVAYITGGIGSDEAAAMRRAEPGYPLALEFVEHAKPRDEYLAGIDVTITGRGGATQLKAQSDGPFLLAKLPPGKYTVRANRDGIEKTRHVTIAANEPKRMVFEW